jgi:hypothetical protein
MNTRPMTLLQQLLCELLAGAAIGLGTCVGFVVGITLIAHLA